MVLTQTAAMSWRKFQQGLVQEQWGLHMFVPLHCLGVGGWALRKASWNRCWLCAVFMKTKMTDLVRQAEKPEQAPILGDMEDTGGGNLAGRDHDAQV